MFLIFRAIFIVCFFGVSACGGYSESGHELAGKYNSFFVENSICQNVSDCHNRELVLVGGGGEDVVLNFYQATSYSAELMGKIIAIPLEFNKEKAGVIVLNFYAVSRKEKNKNFPWRWHKPDLTFEIKRSR